MKIAPINKKGNVSALPGFFQVMMLVVIFAGLTFIVLDKFLDVSYKTTSASVNLEAVTSDDFTNGTGYTLTKSTTERGFVGPSITALYNDTNVLLASGNYTLVGNKLYNATALPGLTNVKVNYTYNYEANTMSSTAINESTYALYDYGIGFLGIVILVTMVYLIISIVSGRKQR